MAFSFQPIGLDTDYGDSEAMLVLRDERLLAVVSYLDAIHGTLGGKWFVETIFRDLRGRPAQPFETLEDVETWLTERIQPQP